MNSNRSSSIETLSSLTIRAKASANEMIVHKSIAWGIPETYEYLIPIYQNEALRSVVPKEYFGKESSEISEALWKHWNSRDNNSIKLIHDLLKDYQPISIKVGGDLAQIRLAKLADDDDTILNSISIDFPPSTLPEISNFFSVIDNFSGPSVYDFLLLFSGFTPESPRIAQFLSVNDFDPVIDSEFYPNIESFENFSSWENSLIICIAPNNDFLVMNENQQFAWMVFAEGKFEKISDTFDEIIQKYCHFFENGYAFDSYNYLKFL